MTHRKLYKYQSFDLYSLQNLARRELYFSKPENLNDPYDCDPPFEINNADRTQIKMKALFDKIKRYEVEKTGIDETEFDQRYSTSGKPDNRFRRRYVDNPKPIKAQISEKVGVTCFSKRGDNFLLWSHYADKHRGFCLEFDVDVLLKVYPGTKLYKVKYPKTNRPIRFSILEVLNNPNLLEKILTRKSFLWQYEEEWRLFCRTGGNEAFSYSSTAITNIYFGQKMAYEHKQVILSILSNSNNQSTTPNQMPINYSNTQVAGTRIGVFDMRLNGRVFKLEQTRFQPKAQ